MVEAFKKFWLGYIDFEGKATVAEFWWAVLGLALGYFALLFLLLIFSLFAAVFAGGSAASVGSLLFAFALFLVLIYHFATLIPLLALTVRRLRDAGYHWAYIFLALVPVSGLVVLIVLSVRPSKA